MTFRDKVLQQLEAEKTTGQRKAMCSPLKVESNWSNVLYATVEEYDLRCVFGFRQFVREGRHNYERAVKLAVDQMTDYVFRDAKDQLRTLEMAYMDGDHRKITEEFNKMWKTLE